MKKILLLIIGITVLFAGCSTPESNGDEKPTIVTTFYPVEEITKEITSNTSNVEVLIPAGNEPHSYEPTPSQTVSLSKADSFVTMGGIFEHVEETIIEANPNMNVIDSSESIYLKDNNHESHEEESHEEESHEEESHEEESHEEESHEEESHEEDHNHEEESHEEDHNHEHNTSSDPHTWLSITNMIEMTQTIEEELIEQYPQYKQQYQQNAEEYISKLENLENNYSTTLNNCRHDTIIVNHKAFGYIADEYGFEQISVAGYSPKAEPTSKGIQKVIEESKKHNLSYVFAEGHLDKKSANTIAKEINGEVLELNPTKRTTNQTYFTIMENNLKNLKKGLECE